LLLDGPERCTALLCVLVFFDVIGYVIESLEAECKQHQFVSLWRAYFLRGCEYSLLYNGGKGFVKRLYFL